MNTLLLPMMVSQAAARQFASQAQRDAADAFATACILSAIYDQTGASMLQGGFLQFLPQDEAGGADPAAEEVVQIIAQVSREQTTAGGRVWYKSGEHAAYLSTPPLTHACCT